LRGVSLSDRSGSARRSPPRHGPLLSVPLVLAGQSLRHQRSELPVAFGRDAEDPGRRGGGGEGRRDHRAGSQSHGLTLCCEGFSRQRARKDTCPRRYSRSARAAEGRVSLSDQSASACRAPPRCSPSLGAALTAVRLRAESRSATAAVALQVFSHHRPKFAISLGGDPEHTGRRHRRRVRGGDHRARSQRHDVSRGLRRRRAACRETRAA
jgi:hypothetical protein